jgi:hypothetical protein
MSMLSNRENCTFRRICLCLDAHFLFLRGRTVSYVWNVILGVRSHWKMRARSATAVARPPDDHTRTTESIHLGTRSAIDVVCESMRHSFHKTCGVEKPLIPGAYSHQRSSPLRATGTISPGEETAGTIPLSLPRPTRWPEGLPRALPVDQPDSDQQCGQPHQGKHPGH